MGCPDDLFAAIVATGSGSDSWFIGLSFIDTIAMLLGDTISISVSFGDRGITVTVPGADVGGAWSAAIFDNAG